MSEERKKEVVGFSMKGWEEINRAETIGGLIISKKATELITQLKKELPVYPGVEEDFWEFLNGTTVVEEKYIKLLQECAKEDLKIKD